LPQWRDKLPCSPHCSPSTHESKIKKLKKLSGLGTGRRKKIKEKEEKGG